MTVGELAEAGRVPPGRARISPCLDCQGAGCDECEGTGKILWRVCPRCGDAAWDYVNGYDEDQGMVCRLACGRRWPSDDPGWLAQIMRR